MSGGGDTTRSARPAAGEAPAAPPAESASVAGHVAERRPSGLANLLLHLHPRTVPAEALELRRTLGLGGAALVLFLALIATGALLLFAYEPSTERAYASVSAVQETVPFGGFVRAIHHWAGNLLLVVAVLHLGRVFYTGAYLPPRRFNWGLGLVMLVLIAAGCFTGYLLPWDQLAYWAVTIGTGMVRYVPLAGEALLRAARGGAEVGPQTLSLFFVLHIALLPIALFLLTSFHFWLVRKAGGVILPRGGGASGGDGAVRGSLVPVRPHLVVREGVAALVLLAALLTLAAVVPAPLGEAANPGMSPNPAKAPWYFMGVQELLVHLHPTFAVVVVPLLCAGFLAGVPFLRHGAPPSGAWFLSRSGRRSAAWAAAAAVTIVPAAVVLDERALHGPRLLPGVAPAIATGLLPLALAAAVVAAVLAVLRRRLALTRMESVQVLATFAMVALAVLTVIGVVFRGAGMRLSLPW